MNARASQTVKTSPPPASPPQGLQFTPDTSLAALVAKAVLAQVLTLKRPPTAHKLEMLPPIQADSPDEALLRKLAQVGSASPDTLTSLSNTSRSSIARVLRRLLRDGKVVAKGKTKARLYSIAPMYAKEVRS